MGHDTSLKRRNIFLYYVMTVGMSCWFISTNWVYFWTRYMTYGQLGWVDAIGFGFAMVLEIPSGAIADLLGKRKTILFGMIAGVIGVSMIAFTDSFNGIFIGWMITQICYAFYSGAAEALVYDTLLDLKDEKLFEKIISKSSQIVSYTSVVVTLIGGFLYEVNFRLPQIFWGMGFLLGAIAAYFLIEPNIDSSKFTFKKYLSQLSTGIKELTHTSLRIFIGFFFVLAGVEYIYSWGFVKPAIATSFGFYSKEQAFIFSGITILFAFLVRFIPYLKSKFSDVSGLFWLSIFVAFGFVGAGFPIGNWGLVPLITIPIASGLATPWISILINKRIESKHRATTLSTVALMAKLPYVLVAITAGKMIETGMLSKFNIILGAVVLFVALGTVVISRRIKTTI